MAKINSAGDLTWQKVLGGSSLDYGRSIALTSDGGCIVGGETLSNDGDVSGLHSDNYRDEWIVKLNGLGEILWERTIGGTNDDAVHSIQQTTDGGYILTGYTLSNDGDVSGNHGSYDFWVIKLNSTGAIVWKKTLGGANSDIAVKIQQTTDGGYIVAGYTLSNDGDITGNHGLADVWVVKLAPDNVATSEVEYTANTVIYPNPTNDFFIVQDAKNSNEKFGYTISDLTGREILHGKSAFGAQINIESLANGSYLLQIQTENGQKANEKIVKK